MARAHRLSTTAALIGCLVATQWSGTLFASEEFSAASVTPTTAASIGQQPDSATDRSSSLLPTIEHSRFTLDAAGLTAPSANSDSFAQRGRYRGRGGRGGRNAGPAAAIVLGAVASVAGAAVLVYANRPDCGPNPRLNGCGYGTKVVGGAVLTGGIIGVVAGTLTWR